MHRPLSRLATLALASVVVVTSAHAAGLQLDGSTSIQKQMGGQVTVTVTGNPNSPVGLLIDISAGPSVVFGQSVPLGFTPAFGFMPLGMTNANGDLSVTLPVPQLPNGQGVTLHLVAVIADPGQPYGLDFSNGASLSLLDPDAEAGAPNIELAGHALGQYPFFEYVRAVNQGSSVELGIDPTRFPTIVGQTGDVYVVASKTLTQWNSNTSLVDVAGGPQTFAFGGTTIQANTLTIDTGTLAGPNAAASSGDTRVGVAYDVVIDLNQNGQFDAGSDLIDGYDETNAGFYVVRDTAAGADPQNPNDGPYPVAQLLYTGGVWLTQVTFYPTNIDSLGQVPLIVVSHGNGHDYQWYDHIGYRMASYGYIVMSHTNETGPGSGTAAATTISNTEFLLQYQNIIGGGVLDGHFDTSNIIWIGHSRGGDGVARAYDDLFNAVVTPTFFSINDIKLIDSIAPVDFGGFSGGAPILAGTSGSHPHNANYHLWIGQSDTDVTGCAGANQVMSYKLHERATGIRQSTSLYGAGHGDFHNAFMFDPFAGGPNLIGRDTTHLIMLGYLLPLIKHYIEGDVPSRDFLWRQYESFRPISVPFQTEIVVNLMFQDDAGSGKFIIDDFQDIATATPTPSPAVASSGAPVTRTTPQYEENILDDPNGSFNHVGGEWFNGFTMDDEGGTGNFRSESAGCVFTVPGKGNYNITYDVSGTVSDWTSYVFLSMRGAQQTRHPITNFLAGDFDFTVTLEDGSATQSSISITATGAGIETPYQRTGCGAEGAGWNNEFETIRLRLTDFLNNGSGIDLSNVSKLIFNFGPAWGTTFGRIGLDEIELTAK